MGLKNTKISNVLLCGCILLFIFASVIYAQTERWVYTYNGPGNSWDEVYSITYGADGNIYSAELRPCCQDKNDGYDL